MTVGRSVGSRWKGYREDVFHIKRVGSQDTYSDLMVDRVVKYVRPIEICFSPLYYT